MKEILTRRGEVKALKEMFQVSEPMVIGALRGRRDTPLAHKIREAALNRGGKETDYNN